MESNHIMLKQNLGLFDILKQALNLTYKYTHFIQLTFLSSLPLFCFSLVYEPLLQTTLVQISEFVRQHHLDSFDYEWKTLLHTATRLIVALMLSASVIRGSERRRHQGLVISLVFFVFGLGLRGSCLFFACCGGRNGVVAHVGVFCIVNVMKWVVFVVYFNNCKRQSLGKKVDDEVVGDDGLTNAKPQMMFMFRQTKDLMSAPVEKSRICRKI